MRHPWWSRSRRPSTCRRSRARSPAPPPTRPPWGPWPSGTGWSPRSSGWAPRSAGPPTLCADSALGRPGVGRLLLVGDRDRQGDLLVVGGDPAALVGRAGVDGHVVG